MKLSHVPTRFWLAIGAMVVLAFFFTSSASAQPVIVLNFYQEIPSKKTQLSQVIDNNVSKELARVKGLEWAKFFYNPSTGERGSVVLWTNQADWEAYLKSDLRKELVKKVQPFIQGEVSSKSYPLYAPKK